MTNGDLQRAVEEGAFRNERSRLTVIDEKSGAAKQLFLTDGSVGRGKSVALGDDMRRLGRPLDLSDAMQEPAVVATEENHVAWTDIGQDRTADDNFVPRINGGNHAGPAGDETEFADLLKKSFRESKRISNWGWWFGHQDFFLFMVHWDCAGILPQARAMVSKTFSH